MIKGIATLLGFQVAGEFVVRLGNLPISGPICGMATLLVWLHFKGGVDNELGKVCDGILGNMALLFVPVGVGAMGHFQMFADAWAVIALAVLVGTGATLLTTAFVTRAMIAWTAESEDGETRPVARKPVTNVPPAAPGNPYAQ